MGFLHIHGISRVYPERQKPKPDLEPAISQTTHQIPITEFLAGIHDNVLNDQIRPDDLTALIHVVILLAGSQTPEKESA